MEVWTDVAIMHTPSILYYYARKVWLKSNFVKFIILYLIK
jgi:hypothetical protein